MLEAIFLRWGLMLLEILNNDLYELLKKDDYKKEFSIQLGYSGGLDSSCLLDALIKCKKDNNLKLFVTYVNSDQA